MQGVYAATDFWWTLEDNIPLAKMFNDAFDKKYGYKPEWGANNAYMQFAHWADAWRRPAPSIRRTSSSPTRRAQDHSVTVGEVYFRPKTTSCVRPVIIVRGKKPKDMKNKEDYYEVVEIVPGEGLMQKPDAFGCHLGDYT